MWPSTAAPRWAACPRPCWRACWEESRRRLRNEAYDPPARRARSRPHAGGAGHVIFAPPVRRISPPAKRWKRQWVILDGRRRVSMKRERQRRERGETDDQRFARVALEELREAWEA